MSEKLIDGEFLGGLMRDSMESKVGAAMEAVADQSDLFGGSDAVDVKVIATYKDHAIVVNSDGQFFKAKIAGDKVESVEEIDVPVVSEEAIGRHVREQANRAVEAILSADFDQAREEIRALYSLARSGSPLTTESVESDAVLRWYTESDWYEAVNDQASKIEGFLDTDLPERVSESNKFDGILDESVDASKYRESVRTALRALKTQMVEMERRLELAKQIDEDYTSPSGEPTAAADFAEFVEGLSGDMESVIDLLSDALAISEDGDIKSLARTHDALAVDLNEWMVATAFAEKLAQRFAVPSDKDGRN